MAVSVMLSLLCRDYWEWQCSCIRPPGEGETAIGENVEDIEQPLRGSLVDWRALRSHDWQTRRNAVAQIGVCFCLEDSSHVTPDVLKALRVTLKDEHWQVRRQSCYALQQLGETAVYGALPLLRQACWDKETSVRSAAALVLQVYGLDMPSRSQTEDHSRELTWQSESAKRSNTGLSLYSYSGVFPKSFSGTVSTGVGNQEFGYFTEDSQEEWPQEFYEVLRSRSSGPSSTRRMPRQDLNVPVLQRSAGDESTPIPINLHSLLEESESTDSQSGGSAQNPEQATERRVPEKTQEQATEMCAPAAILKKEAREDDEGSLDCAHMHLKDELVNIPDAEPGEVRTTILMTIEANGFIPSEHTLTSEMDDRPPVATASKPSASNHQLAPLSRASSHMERLVVRI